MPWDWGSWGSTKIDQEAKGSLKIHGNRLPVVSI